MSAAVRPCGSWPSPLSAAMVAAQSVRLAGVTIEGEAVYWLERRSGDGGRVVLVRRDPDGRLTDVTPAGVNVRTRAHEYGGGACLVSGRSVWFSSFDDQRLYHVEASGSPGTPVPLTPAGPWRYADATLDARRRRLICVREDHTRDDRQPETTIVGVPRDGGESAGLVLVSGDDFYSTPRISPDGSRLAWLSWRHPAMPWDATELWVAEFGPDGRPRDAVRVAGRPDESICQPGWSPDGALYFVSDRGGWWRLYRVPAARVPSGQADPVLRSPPADAEFGRPQWVFGAATWACAGQAHLVVAYTTGGRWRLGVVDVATGGMRTLPTVFEPAEWLAAEPGRAVIVAGSETVSEAVVRIDLESGAEEILRTASDVRLDPAYISRPEPMVFASTDGDTVHAFYYAPANPECVAPAGERPPLVAIGHGGPTSAASATLDLRIQFWTSRGYAVVDVNYRGSSGYGRPYRERLYGAWGLVDVDDMVAAVRHLVAEERADPARLIIRGGSAGGYTALAALAFRPGVFAAAASYYGVSDLEVLARDTHKFESRYLDRLVGPYPEARDVYRARSPIHAADRIACRLILFQGLEDRIVPPNQSEMMARAVRANGWPVAYLTFEGEQHGFRQAATIARCLDAEHSFYGIVFGFTPAEGFAPLPLE